MLRWKFWKVPQEKNFETCHKAKNESFKKFLEDVEAGFTNTPGVGDPTKPYGQDYEDRPRFRDFTAE